ncbi:Phenazine biosynthesis PhzF protein [Penicillium cf. griseofulvum]|uniref:Phenazine biosynthesis PhzF protein n=1 Tax=Penicillium cf. griseofulvum TaxID=2972120 RepID=A0A9W9T1A6_9EURO|nr:Phenazine biosynthesis PhzF protein [Penicillium cf. griseofulvum]KAJ5441283.1 Phenazine biosynthesis PhzF protein [Penicillium cf. griseofulvum]KAJ5449335.1 Phenazine biosynthesis PhzF protein [Penicillium cf. griseofulvum]
MSQLRYYIIDVFSSIAYQGNPLAVVDTTSTTLTSTQMKLLARQFNLSETTFICSPTDPKATWRLRSFLPNGVEVFGAGHNSLGAWWWIADSGLLRDLAQDTKPGQSYFQQLGDNVLPVDVSRSKLGDLVISMRQGEPLFLNQHTNYDSLATSLGISTCDIGLKYSDIVLDRAMVITTSPARHLLVPVRSLDVLKSISFANKEGISKELASTESHNSGIYVFADAETESEPKNPRFEARFFSPGMSMEDPATGSAAGPLAAYLWANNALTSVDNGGARIEVVQGVQTGRRCLMNLSIEPNKGDPVSITISGTGVLVANGNIMVPSSGLSFPEGHC